MNRTAKYPRAAVSAVIEVDGKVLLVKRGCEPNVGLWSFPGGSIELGETAVEAIVREVFEETSLTITVDGVADVRDVISRKEHEVLFHFVIVSFRAHVVSGKLLAGSDAADARWFTIEEIEHLNTTASLLDRLAAMGISRK